MNILRTISIIISFITAILAIELAVKYKRSEGKLLDEVRKPLMNRIIIIIVLNTIMWILNIIYTILKG